MYPEGIALRYLALEAEELFWRMLDHGEFAAAEMSLGAYVARRSKGLDDLVAIPAFPSRMFRHGAIYVPRGSDVHNPSALSGARIGVPEYAMTAGIWVRGFLLDDYGVAPSDVTWVQAGLEEPGRHPRVGTEPSGVRVVDGPAGATLNEMLQASQIDAVISARRPSCYERGECRRLFADVETEERRYFSSTRIFPIMHTVVIQRSLLDREPWVARSLLKAFEAAKDICVRGLAEESALQTSLPFQTSQWEAAISLMGPDPWAYGVEDNRETLNAFLRMATTQGIADSSLSVEALFAESTLTGHRI